MKKYLYLFSALTLATMVGCQNEDDILEVQNESNLEFSASLEDSNGTRTALSDENKVIWLQNDLLSMFGGSDVNQRFKLTSGANTTLGNFGLDEASGGSESDGGSAASLSANAAYYPYDKNVTVSESNGSFTFNAVFPAEQTFSESGTFGIDASPMVAVSTSTLDATLMFKNVGSIFKLPLTGSATITQIKLEGTGGQKLAGNFSITTSNTEVDAASYSHSINADNGVSTITLDCGEGVQLSSSETVFVFAMLPATFGANELKITIYDDAGKKMTYTHTNGFTLERSESAIITAVPYSGNEAAITTEASLKTALSQATSNDPVVVEDDITLEEPLSVESNQNVNLDLNGNTLIFTASTSSMSARATVETEAKAGVLNEGTLTIENGTIIYTNGAFTSSGSEIAAVVNKGKLTLTNVSVESDIYCVKTLGKWTQNTLEEHTGEPEVVTNITGGTYTSSGAYHGSNGEHIYAVYVQDFAKTTISGATIKGDGGVCVNCSVLELTNNQIEATHNSTFGMYIIGTGNITVDEQTAFVTQSGTPVVAYSGSNAQYGKIVYNEKVLNYADANTTLEVPAGVHVVLANEAAAPTLNGKIVNNGTLVIREGTVNYNFSGTYEGWGKTYDETSAIVNKGILTLEDTDVTSNVWAIKTFGTWTNDKFLAEQGEPTVKTTIKGGTIKSENAPHSDTGSHIYAMSNVDNALLTIDEDAQVTGDGVIYATCSKVNVGKATLTATCTTSGNCIYIEDTGIVNTSTDNTTMDTSAGAKVVAFDDSNAQYGVITYNGADVTFADGEKSKVLVE